VRRSQWGYVHLIITLILLCCYFSSQLCLSTVCCLILFTQIIYTVHTELVFKNNSPCPQSEFYDISNNYSLIKLPSVCQMLFKKNTIYHILRLPLLLQPIIVIIFSLLVTFFCYYLFTVITYIIHKYY